MAINCGPAIGMLNPRHIRRAFTIPDDFGEETYSVYVEFSNGDELKIANGITKKDADARLIVISNRIAER